MLREQGRRWVWGRLAEVLDCFRELQGDKGAPPTELILGCAELALAFLKNVPSELPGQLPKDGLWTNCPETEWVGALRLADAALTWPPVVDDQNVQAEFSRALEAAFASGNPLIQFVSATTVRPWHWLRDPDRKRLHHRLVWNTPKHAAVLTWSLSTVSGYSDADRTAVFRFLLSRDDVEDSEQLTGSLGYHVGAWSMVVFASGARSAAADLARDVIESPEIFALLRQSSNRQLFLRELVSGMEDSAKQRWSNTELAADYADFALRAWRLLRPHGSLDKTSEDVVLFALSWLGTKERQERDASKLRLWWQHLLPLVRAVAAEGGKHDCFTLFFSLREGGYNDLAAPQEFLRLGMEFTQRIQTGLRDGSMRLDDVDRAHEEWHSWGESIEDLAEMIDSLRRDGSLRSDLQREQADGLLSALAAEPIRSSKALEVLHRLRNE